MYPDVWNSGNNILCIGHTVQLMFIILYNWCKQMESCCSQMRLRYDCPRESHHTPAPEKYFSKKIYLWWIPCTTSCLKISAGLKENSFLSNSLCQLRCLYRPHSLSCVFVCASVCARQGFVYFSILRSCRIWLIDTLPMKAATGWWISMIHTYL